MPHAATVRLLRRTRLAGISLAICTLTVSFFGGVSAAQAPGTTPSPTHLSISVSSHWVTYGERITVSARLTDQATGLPLAGEQVVIGWWETDFFRTVPRTTSATGRVSLRFRPFDNTSVGADYGGSNTEAASKSASRAINVRQAVTIHSPAESRGADAGTRVLIWGTLAPGYYGMVISDPPQPHYAYVRWHNRSGWHPLIRVELKRQLLPNGKRAFGYKIRVGPRSGVLRTLAPATNFNERGVSRTMHILF